jgi:hypothetical protein
VTSNPTKGGEVTPDGNAFAFSSNAAGLNTATGRDNGGRVQYYLYDDRTRKIVCASCPAGGPPTRNVGIPILGNVAGADGFERALSDDGSRFVFRTLDALVPGDVNQGPDIYEWHDDQVSLITDGVSYPGPSLNSSSSQLWGMSASGRDVLFTSFQRLSPDAMDESQHLYDARLDGGFAPAAPSAACTGEQCQSNPALPPVFSAPGSAGVQGESSAPSVAPKLKAAPRSTSSRSRRLASALRACHKRRARQARRACERAARAVELGVDGGLVGCCSSD